MLVIAQEQTNAKSVQQRVVREFKLAAGEFIPHTLLSKGCRKHAT
jgi:hypothetical protein